ncbi:ORF6N domain-containing protein [Ureibacillus chungkukjangi]|uniref:ORF6N domain-containing protein n=1 Tax=Ureibacillus chungkukjangi TaxID=1202712 RepID=UPI00384AF355
MVQLQELQVIEHKNLRVLTTAQLAASLDTNGKVITRNFQRNKNRYQQGIHYFALTGEELRKFKTERQNDASIKHAAVLYLWTEQGVWLHTKSINTNQAHQAIQALIESYFSITNKTKEPQTLAISFEQFEQLGRRVDALEQLAKNATLHTGEQARLRKAVGARVNELTADKGAQKKLYSSLYAALYERYGVGSYRDIKQYQLQEALRFVEKWRG